MKIVALLALLCAGPVLSAETPIARFDGVATGRTAMFAADGPWMLRWSAESDSALSKIFEMRLYDADSGDYLGIIDEIRDVGAGRKLFRRPGRYEIAVVAQNVSWSLEISHIPPDEASRIKRYHDGQQSLQDSAQAYSRRVREDAFSSWSPVNDRTLLLFEDDDTRGFRITFADDCNGLSEATSLSFVTADIRDVNIYDAILMDDGTYCQFEKVIPTIFD